MLRVLLAAAGKPVDRDDIIAEAWPGDGRRPRDSAASFNVIACHLRRKLAAAGIAMLGPGSGRPKLGGADRGYRLHRREHARTTGV
jgi:Transcriptional regulatory protein, C terminal